LLQILQLIKPFFQSIIFNKKPLFRHGLLLCQRTLFISNLKLKTQKGNEVMHKAQLKEKVKSPKTKVKSPKTKVKSQKTRNKSRRFCLSFRI
jgi:hypothetical protein